MSTPEKPQAAASSAAVQQPKLDTCQVCGKKGGVVFDPEKAPPNRLCYKCAAEYGMQDQDDD